MPRHAQQELEGVGYSYLRFSAKEQERGDSIRRQAGLRDAWFARHPKVIPDESLSLRDLGVSAFRGLHRKGDTHALGHFLKLVESGRVAKGSFLILENLDRLSREDELTATHLFTGLLLAGIRIVQLEPEVIFDRDSGQLEIMRAVLELGRAHGESKMKSKRVGEAWAAKKKAAAAGTPMTGKCPAWLKLVGGKFEFRPGAREVIRRMYAMCRAGHGCRAIAAALNREGVPGWGKGRWEEAYIRKLLARREVLGEFQPMTRGPEGGPKRVPDGPVVRDYYPAVGIPEDEWFAAQAARRQRDRRGGRPPADPDHVNVFAGLLRDARTGKPLHIGGRVDRGRYYRVLFQAGYQQDGDPCVSFPLASFENAVLKGLKEIDPREIVPDEGGKGEAVLELSGRLAAVEGRLAAVNAQIVDGDGDVAAIMAAARTLEAKRRETADALNAARLAAASPLLESWGDAKGLVEVLREAPDPRDARVRLRSAIRRIVLGVECLFVNGLGEVRLAAVQVRFAPADRHRGYLIYHRAARAGAGQKARPAAWDVWTFAEAGLPDLDLREQESVSAIEKKLVRFRRPDHPPRPA